MRVLLDTNVLLRMEEQGHALHQQAVSAIDTLDKQGHECVLVPQVLYEYWGVATRPVNVNGLGMNSTTAEAAMKEWASTFRLLLDERGIFRLWRDLVTTFQVHGKNAHDARLVAAMQRHSLTHLLSFNKPDFSRFSAIQVFTPEELLAGQLPS